jgi:hypothetical protein
MPGEKVAGAQGRNRTTDTAIFSRMLYQLSYLGPVLRVEGLIERPRRLVQTASAICVTRQIR